MDTRGIRDAAIVVPAASPGSSVEPRPLGDGDHVDGGGGTRVLGGVIVGPGPLGSTGKTISGLGRDEGDVFTFTADTTGVIGGEAVGPEPPSGSTVPSKLGMEVDEGDVFVVRMNDPVGDGDEDAEDDAPHLDVPRAEFFTAPSSPVRPRSGFDPAGTVVSHAGVLPGSPRLRPRSRLHSGCESTFGYDEAPPLLKPTVQLMASRLSQMLSWELRRLSAVRHRSALSSIFGADALAPTQDPVNPSSADNTEESTFGYDSSPPRLKPVVAFLNGALRDLAARARGGGGGGGGGSDDAAGPPPSGPGVLPLGTVAEESARALPSSEPATVAGDAVAVNVEAATRSPALLGVELEPWMKGLLLFDGEDRLRFDPFASPEESPHSSTRSSISAVPVLAGAAVSATQMLAPAEQQLLLQQQQWPVSEGGRMRIGSGHVALASDVSTVAYAGSQTVARQQQPSIQIIAGCGSLADAVSTFGYDGLPPGIPFSSVQPAVDAITNKVSAAKRQLAATGTELVESVRESVAKRAQVVVPVGPEVPDDYTDESTFGFDPLPSMFAGRVVVASVAKRANGAKEAVKGSVNTLAESTASKVVAVKGSVANAASGAAAVVTARANSSVKVVKGAAVAVAGRAQNAATVVVERAQGAANVVVNTASVAREAAKQVPKGVASAAAGGIRIAGDVATNLSPSRVIASVSKVVLGGIPDRVVEQYADEVVNFSSQYGLSSYSAENLAGHPRIYPDYGDITKAFVLREYGPWWQRSPAFPPPISRFSETFTVKDFVEIRFRTPVRPISITVFETYNPGSIVRVLAQPYNAHKDGTAWKVLWTGVPETELPACSRAFSPPLNPAQYLTNVIRLEFDHLGVDYYAQLDAVELVGSPSMDGDERSIVTVPDALESCQNSAATSRLLRRISQHSISALEQSGSFDLLPDELIWCILHSLELPELLRIACVNRRLFALAYQVMMGLTALDLQPFWDKITDKLLFSLIVRLPNVRRLSLSWASAGPSQISINGFETFVSLTGTKLRSLRLACCLFVTDESLQTVIKAAPEIEDLDLQCCQNVTARGLDVLGTLTRLTRLNLYNTKADAQALTPVAAAAPFMEHLNLGHCKDIIGEHWDIVIRAFAQNCPGLKSLDLWRARTLTDGAILEIAQNCPLLESLDIGWCRVDCPACIPIVAVKCPKLRKLFMTAIRGVDDSCLVALAKHSRELEQLDMLGSSLVTVEVIESIIRNCPRLELLDVSFCRNVDATAVALLRRKTSTAFIKMSKGSG